MNQTIAVLALTATFVWTAATPARAAPAAPILTSPEDGATLDTFGPTLTWSNPGGATQYHVQVIPPGNEGPGIDLYVGGIGNSYAVPAPPRWYGLLPDMTYTWRVRVSDAGVSAPLADPSWGPWAERRFRTPKVASDTIAPATPALGDVVVSRTPTLQWTDDLPEVFYYEIQVSKDGSFVTDPGRTNAAVYWELRHSGLTSPLDSYTIPDSAPLEDNTTYYWRVRPRIQGDGLPVNWSATFTFQVNTRSTTPRVRVEQINFGLNAPVKETCAAMAAGSTFASTPTLTGVYFVVKYGGAGTIVRNWYWNGRPASAISAIVEANDTCMTGSQGTPGGGPDAGVPMGPGEYRLEVWHAGQRAAASEFTVTPPTDFTIGPIAFGTALEETRTCRVSGTASSFPRTIKTVYPRFNFVGNGSFSALIWRGLTRIARIPEVTIPSTFTYGCVKDLDFSPEGGFVPGNYRLDIVVGDRIAQSGTFTIN